MPTDHWQFWAILSAVFAAGTAIFAKVGVRDVDPDLATLIRTGIVFALLALLIAATGKLQAWPQLSRTTWGFLTLSAAATGASWLCYFRALQLGPASQVAPMDKLSVVLVAVFAVIFLGERPAGREWLGIAMIASGIVMLSWKR